MEMTTIESPVLDLFDACAEAGEGGLVQREGHTYTVGLDEEGNYTLTSDAQRTAARSTFLQDSWRVERVGLGEFEEEPEVVETVREFFSNLNMWTFVQSEGGGTQFLYTGIDWDENGKEFVGLVHSRYLNDVQLHEDTLQCSNAYEVVTELDGTPRVAEQMVRMLVRQLRSERASSAGFAERYEQTAERLSKVTSDFYTINRKINEYADESGYCSDYERRIFGWNTELLELNLSGREGRHFTFHVPVRIPTLSEATMYVMVSGEQTGIQSPREAKEYVQNMSSQQVLKSLYDTGFHVDFELDTDEEVNY